MKNTGVVRKIDDLGRIVIPKEIRKSLNIRNGEDLQIFVDNDNIVLKKFVKILSIKEYTEILINELKKYTDSIICITDKEKIIVSTDRSYIGILNNKKILESIEERKILQDYQLFFQDKVIDKHFLILPIIVDADAIGTIVLINNNKIDDKDKILSNILRSLLTLKMY